MPFLLIPYLVVILDNLVVTLRVEKSLGNSFQTMNSGVKSITGLREPS